MRVLPQLALLNNLYHTCELSNAALYDFVPKGISKIQQVKVENFYFYEVNLVVLTFICQMDKDVATLSTSIRHLEKWQFDT